MPIYEYVCTKCEKEFEVIQFSRDDAPECPECGAKDPCRKMSSFGFSVGYKFKSSSSGGSGSSCASCGSSNCSSCGS